VTAEVCPVTDESMLLQVGMSHTDSRRNTRMDSGVPVPQRAAQTIAAAQILQPDSAVQTARRLSADGLTPESAHADLGASGAQVEKAPWKRLAALLDQTTSVGSHEDPNVTNNNITVVVNTDSDSAPGAVASVVRAIENATNTTTIAPASTPVTTTTMTTTTIDTWSLNLGNVSSECLKALQGEKWDFPAQGLLCAAVNGTVCEGMPVNGKDEKAGGSLCLPKVCSSNSDLQSMELSMNTEPMTISCPEYLERAANVTVSNGTEVDSDKHAKTNRTILIAVLVTIAAVIVVGALVFGAIVFFRSKQES